VRAAADGFGYSPGSAVAATRLVKGAALAQITYLEAIRQALWEELERDPSVFIMGEDIGEYGGAFKVTEGFLAHFGPERIIDTPIVESGMVGAAAGAAIAGQRPIVEMQFIDFIANAFDQLVNFVAKSHWRWGQPMPLVVRGPSGGGVRGGPFHSQNPEGFFAHVPGLKIVQPATAYDAKGLLKAAVRDADPVLFLEHKFLYRRIKEELPAADYVVPIGKAAVRRPEPPALRAPHPRCWQHRHVRLSDDANVQIVRKIERQPVPAVVQIDAHGFVSENAE